MKNTIVVGSAGCGKTTLSKQLAIEDVDDNLKILIVDSLDEYSHKFFDYDTNTIKLLNYDDSMEFEFEKPVNILLIDDIDLNKEKAHTLIEKVFEYAEMYQIDTIYIDDLLSYTLLECIDDFEKFKDSFNLMVVTQSLNNFFNHSAIYKFFKEIIVMKISLLDIECLRDNYHIKKRSLNDCLDFGLRSSFNIYDLN